MIEKKFDAKSRTAKHYLPGFSEQIAELQVGESVKVSGFENARDLRSFSGDNLIIMQNYERAYIHDINELYLTYSVRRI